jgi:chitin disaccharide deacetylase
VKVVFHADDFGLTRAVNAGILEGHARGILGSTSLMVTAGAADDAVAGARATPGLDVGLHLTLVEERPALAAAAVPTLVGADGRFWASHGRIVARYLARRWSTDQAARELRAQWERFDAHGLRASHCDGHQHLHLLPGVLPDVVREAHGRGVRFVRLRLGDPLTAGGGLVRSGLLLALRRVARRAAARVPAGQRATLLPSVTVGFLQAGGALTTRILLDILDRLRARLRPPVVEVMLHPGHRDADTARRYAHWGYQWERDLALLLDPALPEALAARGIEVTSFRALAAARLAAA